MLVLALKPGHDGTAAIVRDRKLLYSIEAEKDSFGRYSALTPTAILAAAELIGDVPDVVALGGWREQGTMRHRQIGAGYDGLRDVINRPTRFFGRAVRFFSSSHERSHIMMALGMAPAGRHPIQTVLVWEGDTGALYVIDERYDVIRTIPVLTEPGGRFAFLFALADATFPDNGALPRLGDSGKLMALAAYGKAAGTDAGRIATVDRILALDTVYPAPKHAFRDSPLYNVGVEAEATKAAAALLTDRIFTMFATVARQQLPAGTPLRISGGCGLNCDWNAAWTEFGHFSSVFVPPCTNDSGSAIGTAADALAALTGDPHIDWDVYSGLEFVNDGEPDASHWQRSPADDRLLARALGEGRIVAWVQGRWEIGPRALGNRSILAEPFGEETRQRLNAIKQREQYRPIAPACRVEDLAAAFHEDFDDPYMLYFRRVREEQGLRAVTHVDGSARVQTVSRSSNRKLYDLLSQFARVRGLGILCNTSLNFSGHGFINRMTDLVRFCESRGISDMVVGDTWYRHRQPG
jgi:hydroxymethyl cephem carbamoyltransferase